jgi:hypothetical protein
LLPALFTSTCSDGSRAASAVASSRHPASVLQSAGNATHVPAFESSAATRSQTSAFRAET